MAYKFNFNQNSYREGEYGSKTIANVYGNFLREGIGSRTLLNIDSTRKYVREGTGSRTLCNISGDEIREGTGSRRIGKISSDVLKSIKNCTGSPIDVAFWYKFCR